ncbi:MAG: hypothetical protein IT169_11065 [Bryobacterales bacterium]|nr:hypothetical protein [Bryobacterales bacterium]
MKNLHRPLLISSFLLLALFAVSCTKTESPAPATENAAAPAPEATTPGAETPAPAPAASSSVAPAPATTRPNSNATSSTPPRTNPAQNRQENANTAASNGWGDKPASGSHVSTAPAAPVLKTYTLPSGSGIRVQTTSTLSTKTVQQGATFAGSLAEPLTVDGKVIAARGADVVGRVVESDDGGRIKGKAFLEVSLTSLELVNGDRVSIQTSTFGQEAKSTKKKDAAKVGIASGIGAAIGAIAGGGKGAAIGAGVGAGAGTGAVLATKGEAAIIPAESVINFRTESPISVQLK